MVLVWLKRDLRLRDHAPLTIAARECRQSGEPLAIVYLREPSITKAPDHDDRHRRFIDQSIASLNRQLAPYDLRVQVFEEEAIDFFRRAVIECPRLRLFSHRETGNKVTYHRDLKIGEFFLRAGLTWREFQSCAVVRGRFDGEDWIKHFESCVGGSMWRFDPRGVHQFLVSGREAVIQTTGGEEFQTGGEEIALDVLDVFLRTGLTKYRASLTHPLLFADGSSRLSPYLAWGNISTRHVWQTVGRAFGERTNDLDARAFRARLHWRDYYVQRFEESPWMETRNLNRAFDKIRTDVDANRVRTFTNGETGFPIIDASVRCLRTKGWLPFRLRAMLVSFFTHHLWQPWQASWDFFSSQYIDSEPGLLAGQLQIQSSSMGLQPARIFNPVLQSEEQDPDGVFLRRWLPELAAVPNAAIHAPWTMTPFEEITSGVQLGRDYPRRIVNHELAAKRARDLLNQVRESKESREEIERLHLRNPPPAAEGDSARPTEQLALENVRERHP